MPPDSNPKPTRLTDFSPLFPTDRLKAPQAVELDSATAWAEFERLSADAAAPADPAFAHTVVEPLASLDTPGQAQHAGHPPDLQEVMVEARRGNRVCPKPAAWQRLYAVLAPDAAGQQPPRPIDAAHWQATGAMAKRMCLRDQIEWAERQGSLGAMMAFLKALHEDEWVYMGTN